MNKPHKHAEVIKAWADGKEVEYLAIAPNKQELISGPYPSWLETREYRIKPEPKKVWVKAVQWLNTRLPGAYTALDEKEKIRVDLVIKTNNNIITHTSDWVEITLNE